MIRRLINKLMTGRNLIFCANIAEGTHGDGCITKKTDAAQALRHVLVKVGSDIDHVAVTTAATERPLGICDDEATAAEEIINVQMLGQKQGTMLVAAHGAIDAEAELVAAAAGRVDALDTGTNGTYYIVGRALNATTAQDQLIEMAHCFPTQRVISGN